MAGARGCVAGMGMPETPGTREAVGRSAGRRAALSDFDLSTPTGGGQVRGRGGPTCRALQQQLHWERKQRQQQQQQDTAGTRRQLQQLQQQFPACRAPPPPYLAPTSRGAEVEV